MFSIIAEASAQEAVASTTSQASTFTQLIPLILIIAVFYFFMIRPQQKRAKEHRNMINAVKKGDYILTTGGIFATVIKSTPEENFVIAEIAENVRVKLKRDTIVEIGNANDGEVNKKIDKSTTEKSVISKNKKTKQKSNDK